MTICERLFNELEARNLTAYGLSKALDIGVGIPGNWKKRNTDPPAKYIIPICEYLGCSIEYLLTGEEKEPKPTVLSENGQEMLKLYELLPEREQLILLGRLQEMTAPLTSAAKNRNPASSEGRAG